MLTFLLAALFPIPPRYDYPPRVPVHVIEASRATVHRVCAKAAGYRGGNRILACAIPTKNRCTIIWPQGVPRSGHMWRHEMAHCNGWNHGWVNR